MINLGLWAYDALALFRNFRNHEWLSNDGITRRSAQSGPDRADTDHRK